LADMIYGLTVALMQNLNKNIELGES